MPATLFRRSEFSPPCLYAAALVVALLAVAMVAAAFLLRDWAATLTAAALLALAVLLLFHVRILRHHAMVLLQLQETRQGYQQLRQENALILDALGEGVIGVDRAGRATLVNPAAEALLGWSSAELIGEELHARIHHTRHDGTPFPAEECPVFQPLRGGKALRVEEDLFWRKDGSALAVAYTTAPIRGRDGELIGAVLAFADIGGRKEAEAALRRANRALRTLSACNRALGLSERTDTLLQEVCDIIVGLGGYRLAWVGLCGAPPECAIRPIASAGYDDGYLATLDIDWAGGTRSEGPTGRAARLHRPTVVRDVAEDERFAPWREAALCRGYRSVIGLPLTDATGTFGVLTLYAGEANAFDAGEMELLVELAGNLSYGIVALRRRDEHHRAEAERAATLDENRRLTRQLYRVQEEERWLIAKELHDELGQLLVAMKTEGHLLSSAGGPAGATIVALTDEMRRVIRAILTRLRPALLEQLGLRGALRELVRGWEGHQAGVTAELLLRGPLDRLNLEVAHACYRLVQEALTNVARHAAAENVRVEVRADGKRLTVAVTDDGGGIAAGKGPGSHLGLGQLGMRERVAALAGTLTIDSSPGQGVRVRAEIPLVPPREEGVAKGDERRDPGTGRRQAGGAAAARPAGPAGEEE